MTISIQLILHIRRLGSINMEGIIIYIIFFMHKFICLTAVEYSVVQLISTYLNGNVKKRRETGRGEE